MDKNNWEEFGSLGSVVAAKYILTSRTLSIRFNNGTTCSYLDVPQSFWWGICCADSKDSFFSKHIADQFISEGVPAFSLILGRGKVVIPTEPSEGSPLENFRRWAGPSKVLSVEDFKAYVLRANNCDASAQFTLGKDYLLFRGEPGLAATWFFKSAFLGYKSSQKALSLLYASGLGVKLDEVESSAWLKLSEDIYAKSHSQIMYTPADNDGQWNSTLERPEVAARVAAIRLMITPKPAAKKVPVRSDFIDEAETGEPLAQTNLGLSFLADIEEHHADAIYWLKRAANQGEKRAQETLGDLFSTGRAVAKSDTESYKWYILAASKGLGRDKLNELEERLTPSQREEGQRRAERFEPVLENPLED